QVADQMKTPSVFYGVWQDLNWLGSSQPPISLGPSAGVRLLCSPFGIMILILALIAMRIPHRKLVRATGYSCLIVAAIIITGMICHACGVIQELDWAVALGGMWFIGSIII